MKNILIDNTQIVTMSGDVLAFEGYIGIEGNTIAMVTANKEEAEQFKNRYGDNLKVIDGRGHLTIPGLINTHGHVAMTLMRSMADDIPLMDWLNNHIWPFEAKINRDDVYVGAKL